MCAALQEQGVAAGRLLPLRPGSAARRRQVMVTSVSASSQLADEYAPALIASFGSGGGRIEVRTIEPGGAAAYEPRCGPISPPARAGGLSCSETGVSGLPRRTPRSSGRAR